jgi:hypothetical protein
MVVAVVEQAKQEALQDQLMLVAVETVQALLLLVHQCKDLVVAVVDLLRHKETLEVMVVQVMVVEEEVHQGNLQ